LNYGTRANELNLTSRTKLFVNVKGAELELKKRFVSNSSRVSSRVDSYRVELRQVRLDSFPSLLKWFWDMGESN